MNSDIKFTKDNRQSYIQFLDVLGLKERQQMLPTLITKWQIHIRTSILDLVTHITKQLIDNTEDILLTRIHVRNNNIISFAHTFNLRNQKVAILVKQLNNILEEDQTTKEKFKMLKRQPKNCVTLSSKRSINKHSKGSKDIFSFKLYSL